MSLWRPLFGSTNANVISLQSCFSSVMLKNVRNDSNIYCVQYEPFNSISLKITRRTLCKVFGP